MYSRNSAMATRDIWGEWNVRFISDDRGVSLLA